MTSWLGITSPGEKSGSFLTEVVDFLTQVEFLLVDGFCDFLSAIFVMQKFMDEEVRD